MAHRPRRTRAALTLVEAIIVIAIAVVVIALFTPAFRGGGDAREAARRTSCLNSLKQIQLGLLDYESFHGEFPPAYTADDQGNPLHSWRTLILPFIGENALYEKIDLAKPWDDPANARALSNMPRLYHCPSYRELDNRSTYLAVVTSESFLQAAEPRKLADIKDGLSRTMAIIDVDHDHAVPWMAPVDADEELILGLGGPNSPAPHRGDFNFAYADAHVESHFADTPADVRRQLISIASDEPAGSEAPAERTSVEESP
jgi:prepilin-type processing-associated H-X9-DG protein